MNIKLSDHFTYKRLISFALPSIVMMIFTSIYSVVDGICISSFVGETEFAAVNLVMPYLTIFNAFGFMLGTGGSALISKLMGEGNSKKANEVFSMLMYVSFGLGIIFVFLGKTLLLPVARLLGAEGYLLEVCVLYGNIVLVTLPIFMLQYSCQSYLVTAQKPQLGLIFTVSAGVLNMVLDILFMAVFNMGVAGAAYATCIGQIVGGVGPAVYFIFNKKGILRLGRPVFLGRDLIKACSNGMADFLSNLSMSLVNTVYNYQLMQYSGEYGVSAYGIIMYVSFIFNAVYFGYSMGVAPIIAYHYGAKDKEELHNLYTKSKTLIICASVVLTSLAELSSPALAGLFAAGDMEYKSISLRALRIYSISYLFAGINIFTGSLFSALNNGRLSGMLSGLRTFVFQLMFVILLPMIFKLDGIWFSVVLADFCMLVINIIVTERNKKKYGL